MIMTSLWEGTSAFFFFNLSGCQHMLENRKEWLSLLMQISLGVLHATGRLDASVVIWGKVSVVLWEKWDFRASSFRFESLFQDLEYFFFFFNLFEP